MMMALKAATASASAAKAAGATSVTVGDTNGNGKWKTKRGCFFMWASSSSLCGKLIFFVCPGGGCPKCESKIATPTALSSIISISHHAVGYSSLFPLLSSPCFSPATVLSCCLLLAFCMAERFLALCLACLI